MSRRRWQYVKARGDSDDAALGTMLFSDYVTQTKLSLNRQPRLPLDMSGQTWLKSLEQIKSVFDPMTWSVLCDYTAARKPRMTKAEAAARLGVSRYRFGKEVKRLHTLLEMAVATLC